MAQAIWIPNTSTSRRKALTSIAGSAGAAAVVTPVVAAQAAREEDPIFALIEAHRTLEKEREKVLTREKRLGFRRLHGCYRGRVGCTCSGARDSTHDLGGRSSSPRLCSRAIC